MRKVQLIINTKRKIATGFSLVEVLLSAAVFALIVTALVGAWLYGQEATALAGQRARATQLAQEGSEAVRSIRDDAFSNVVDGTYGLELSGGVWTLSGSSDAIGEFTRTVTISSIDANTRSITVSVAWQQNAQRTGTTESTSYLTNWQAPAGGGGSASTGSGRGGVFAYADLSGADDVIRYKTLDGGTGTWSAELTVPDLAVPGDRATRHLELYSSPTRNEVLMLTQNAQNGGGDDTYIYASVWDGTAWNDDDIGTEQVLLASWAGSGNAGERDYDGAYLDNGDFMVVYSDDTSTPKYRIWDGSNWSAESSTVNVGGTPAWIVLRQRPGTNEAMLAVKDQSADTNTSFWDGGTWSAATEHATNSSASGIETIGFEWSPNASTLGALTFNDANNERLPNIRIFNSTTASWSTNIENSDIGGNVRAGVIAANPGATDWIACFNDSNSDINCLDTTSTPSWTDLAEVATNTTGAQRTHGIAYEQQAQNQALLVYAEGVDAAAQQIPKWRTFDPATNTWSAQDELATLGASMQTTILIPDPSGDDVMAIMADADLDVWTAVWDGATDAFFGAAGLEQTEHGQNGSNASDLWYDFAWDQY